jgi:protein SCO1/2
MKLSRRFSLIGLIGIAAAVANGADIYSVHGILQSYDASRRQATISHEAIPGYMPAMTMPFDVGDPGALAGLAPGAALDFHLNVTPAAAWIDHIQPGAQAGAAPFAHVQAAPAAELQPGDPMPDVAFVNQLGAPAALRDFRGRAVAITFIYLRCPLPNYCPLLNRNFQAAQALLNQLEPGKPWSLLSVSLDPAHDTPEALQSFAQGFQAQPEHWSFLSGPLESVRLLGNAVGLEFSDQGGVISHNLRTAVIDPAGRLRKVFKGNEWTPQELVAEVRAAMKSR